MARLRGSWRRRRASVLAGSGDDGRLEMSRLVDLRYDGPVVRADHRRCPRAATGAAALDADAAFAREHERTYGHASPDDPISLVNLRLTAAGAPPERPRPAGRLAAGAGEPAPRRATPGSGAAHGVAADARCSAAADLTRPAAQRARCSSTSTTPPTLVPPRRGRRARRARQHRRSRRRTAAMTPAGLDPIRLELIKNALDAIVDEMAIALMRSAYSTNIKTAMDMSLRAVRRRRPADRAGPDPAAAPRLDPGRDARGPPQVRRAHRAGRRRSCSTTRTRAARTCPTSTCSSRSSSASGWSAGR